MAQTRSTRPISWLKAARQEFETFPEGARRICLTALTIAAEGGKADIVKTNPRPWVGRAGNRFSSQEQCVPSCLRLPGWRGYLGASRISEEIDQGDRDSKARDRSREGAP